VKITPPEERNINMVLSDGGKFLQRVVANSIAHTSAALLLFEED
jgi:hypothetical protein